MSDISLERKYFVSKTSLIGKHMWIWRTDKLKGGNPERMAITARELGLKSVIVKYHEGSQTHARGGYDFQSQYRNVADYFSSAGVNVGAWGFNYFNHPEQEAQRVIEAIEDGCDYYVFNAESPVSGKYAETREVISIVKEQYPDFPLGHSPVPGQNYPSEYPYEEFEEACDFIMPQVYWEHWGQTPEEGIERLENAIKRYNITTTVIPIAQVYNNASPVDVVKFTRLCREKYGNRISFWSWQHCQGTMLENAVKVC